MQLTQWLILIAFLFSILQVPCISCLFEHEQASHEVIAMHDDAQQPCHHMTLAEKQSNPDAATHCADGHCLKCGANYMPALTAVLADTLRVYQTNNAYHYSVISTIPPMNDHPPKIRL